MDQVDFLRECVIENQGVSKFRLIVGDLIAGGADREQLLSDLERIRAEFRSVGRDVIEDRVMEIMDFVVGWCGPHMKI